VPEFKPVDTLLTTKGNEMDRQMRRFRRPMRMYDRGDGLPFERFGDGWFAAGCVFGPDFGAVRMFVDAEGLPKLTGNRETSAAPPRPWNRQVANGMLLSGADQRIAQLDDRIAIILPDSPVCVALNYGRGDEARWTGDNRQRFTAKLTFLELLSGTTVLTIPLIDSTLTNEAVQLYSANRGVSPLQSHGRQVFALLGDRLFILGIDDETLKKCASPFQFEPPKEVTTVSPKGPTTIKHAMRGGQAPFEFEFKTQRDGLTIDTKTGTVTVDGPKLSKQALELVLQWMQTGLDRDPYDRRPQPDAKQAVADFTKKQKARFAQLAGREPAGIPVLVPVSVTASDKNQQVASLDYEVVLEVPDDAIQQFISLKAEEQKQRMAEAEKQRAEAERRMREQEKKWADEQRKRDAETPAAGGADERVRKLEERIAELDEKIKSLEAKIDLLVKLIQSQKTPDERK
jgi:hypothetical protein